jgi:KDO2-lipid IV(A) lauroyltransferase
MRRAGAALLALRDLGVAAAVVVLAAPLWFLPWRAAAALGRAYGHLAWLVWPLGRRVAMVNLRRALSLDRAAARAVTRASLANLGGALADGLQAARRRGRPLDHLCRLDDPDLAARLVADPRPKVFVTAHLGSFELAAAVLARQFGERGGAIARRLDNPFLDALVRRLRVVAPGQWLEKRGATSAALDRLRGGDSVALLLDEDAGRRGIFVDFFGRPASTQRTAALLALMSGAQLVVGAVTRTPSGERRFRLAEVEVTSEETTSGAVAALTRRATAVLEAWIREDPTQWRWVHWRWRQRPDGGRETYTRRDQERAFLLR